MKVLEPYMEYGIANAKRLDELNNGRTPATSAPGTKVYELLEALKPYLYSPATATSFAEEVWAGEN